MSDNPFKKAIEKSLENINKVQKIKSRLKMLLTQASEELNKTLPGSSTLSLDISINQGKLSRTPGLYQVLLNNPLAKDEGRGFVFISNELSGELIASWQILEDTNEITFTINKIQENYSADDNGLINAINDILSQKNIMEKALELKKGSFTF